MSGLFDALAAALRAEQPVALAEVIEGPPELLGGKLLVLPGPPFETLGTVGDTDLDRVIGRDAMGELAAGLSVTRHYGRHGEARARDVSVFIESFAPPPRMIIFGAVDFTAALAKVAKILGYRVTVCDARPVFATRARFPMADEVVVAWPDKHLAEVGASLGPRDAVCVLTHDPKFDVPAIRAALATDVGYLGAMGSRRTHTDRTAPPARGRGRRGRPGPDHGAHRPGHRGPYSRGDRGLHLRRDHRPANGPHRPVAPRQRRTHPPGSRRRHPPGVGLSRRVGAAVLAAGGGSRFSTGPDAAHKLLAPWRGRPLVWAAAANAVASGLTPVWVVAGAVDLSGHLPDGVAVLSNPAWAEGQATSLQVAVQAARAAGLDALVVGLGDQPLISPEAWAAVGRRRCSDRRSHLRRGTSQPGQSERRRVGPAPDGGRSGGPGGDQPEAGSRSGGTVPG